MSKRKVFASAATSALVAVGLLVAWFAMLAVLGVSVRFVWWIVAL